MITTPCPYVGITGFTTPDQVRQMLKVWEQNKTKGSHRRLHVGVMMSKKTLHGIESKWSKVFPPKEDIHHIFCSERAFNCLHYADYEHDSNSWKDLVIAIGHGGYMMDAIQLDMIWPEPSLITIGIHTSRKSPYVILQVGKNAIDEVGGDHEEIIRRLHGYSSVVHYVLIDQSMGKGVGMNTEETLILVRKIRQELPQFKIVVAGGLGPDTMNLVEPIATEFPYISVDAQGQLCPEGNALNPTDWDRAEAYLISAQKILH